MNKMRKTLFFFSFLELKAEMLQNKMARNKTPYYSLREPHGKKNCDLPKEPCFFCVIIAYLRLLLFAFPSNFPNRKESRHKLVE